MKSKVNIILNFVCVTIFSIVILGCDKEPVQEYESGSNDSILKQAVSRTLIPDKQYYYWYNGQKVYLDIDKSKMIVYDQGILSDTVTSNINRIGLSLNKTNLNYYELNLKGSNDLSKIDFHRIGLLDVLPMLKIGETNTIPNGELVLQLKDNESIESVLNIIREDVKGYKKKKYNVYAIEIKNVSKIFMLSNKIYETKNLVEWCQPNFYADIKKYSFNDPLYNQQFYLSSLNGIDINAQEALDITEGSDQIRIAVIDDGVETHPELAGRVEIGFSPRSATEFGAPTNAGSGHGQACAGIIGASNNNNAGIVGIAPRVKIIPVNIFHGGETVMDIADAINWSWDEGEADILSNSWGYPFTGSGGVGFDPIRGAINNARVFGRQGNGAVVVFASGNGHATISGVTFPANTTGVLSVGAIQRNGSIWSYSSRGPELSVVAPSGNTSQLGDVTTIDRIGSNGYNAGDYMSNFGGTSAACPQAAGLAALLLSVAPELTESQVRSHITLSAIDLGTAGFDNTFGHGLLNAEAAIKRVIPDIAGPTSICTSGVFTLSSVPSGSTISWSSDNPLLTISGSSSASSATFNTSTGGTANIIATISKGGTSYKVKKLVSFGAGFSGVISFGSGTAELKSTNCLKKLSGGSSYYETVSVSPNQPSSTVTWEIISKTMPSTVANISGSGNSRTVTVSPSGHHAVIKITVSNMCGVTSRNYAFVANGTCEY